MTLVPPLYSAIDTPRGADVERKMWHITEKCASTAPARALGVDKYANSKARYKPIGRRLSVGNSETLPKRASALEINRSFLSHRLRSYGAQCSMITASKPSFATV